MYIALSLIFGTVVGLALGLTGGGGSVLAVPLLVYGLGVPPREAIGASLLTVGTIALAGVVGRWLRGEVDLPAGFLFSGAAMLGTPLGVHIGRQLPEHLLLLGFAGLMGLVAVRMWKKASPSPADARTQQRCPNSHSFPDNKAALLDSSDPETFPSSLPGGAAPRRRWLVFLGASLFTGILAGLFGIGGGFLIVPALVLVVRLDMKRAAATSLLVIFLISLAGALSYFRAGQIPPLRVAIPFILGGLGGMALGVTLSRHLSGPALQRVFAVMLLAVVAVMVSQTLPPLWRSFVTY